MAAADTALLSALSDADLSLHFEPKILARGKALVADVTQFQSTQEGAVLAATGRVKGSQSPYRVQLHHAPGTRLRGHCECIYAEGGLPCKHQAALALTWRASLSGEVLVASPPVVAPKRKARAAPPEAPLADPLQQEGASEMLAKMIDMAKAYPAMQAELLRMQGASRAPTPPGPERSPADDLTSAKKAITALLNPPGDLIQWRRVGAYVRKAEAVLGLLQGWTATQPSLALGAAEWALTKLRRVWEQADDSNGAIGGLMAELAEHWLTALQAAGPQEAAFAERYAKLLKADEHQLFDQATALTAMGPAAAARYGQLVQADWLACQSQPRSIGSPAWDTLRRLLSHLQASGDWPSELALRRANLDGVSDHLDLIERLQQTGHAREALQAAEHAHRLHGHHPSVQACLIAAYERDGWDEEALALRRQAFEREPSCAGYHAVLAAAQAAGQDLQTTREALWAVLDVAAKQGSDNWTGVAIGQLRLQLWADEARWREALDWLEAHPAWAVQFSTDALRDFARALPPEHHETAAHLLKQALERAMDRASSPYAAELRLVRDTLDCLQPPQRNLWLAFLKLQYRSKTRFVQGLVGL
ncbi:MAG: SWIM zinc finger domain-containing protein [Burkholderiales bacterium]|jgi:hypothetical protein